MMRMLPGQVVLVLIVIAGFAVTAHAQGASSAPATPQPVIAAPTYTTIPLEITVNRPAADVWKRIGKYCDIADWLRVNCTILSGKDGEVGAVRSVANEVLVARTEFSYTYTQPVLVGRPYNLYHGTLEVRPLTATTSRIIYTLLYDNSMLPDDDARARDKARRTATFQGAIENMKVLAEGGTLPPAPARADGPAGVPAAPGRGN